MRNVFCIEQQVQFQAIPAKRRSFPCRGGRQRGNLGAKTLINLPRNDEVYFVEKAKHDSFQRTSFLIKVALLFVVMAGGPYVYGRCLGNRAQTSKADCEIEWPCTYCWLWVAMVCLIMAEPSLGDAGIDTSLLEDSPDKPLNSMGRPVVSGEPADWWFDGGVVAPPDFSVDGGIFLESVVVKIFCGTLDASIYYNLGYDLDSIPDPTEENGIMYNALEPVVFMRNGYIKAAAFHPFAFDSEISTTDQIRIRVRSIFFLQRSKRLENPVHPWRFCF